MVIGICDDNESDLLRIERFCETYMNENGVCCQYKRFLNGEEVIQYCEDPENPIIHLLFLDVELPGINGIDLKERIMKNNLIYRIAFITNYKENVYRAFSLKTIGFIDKPFAQEDISKMINLTQEELKDNIVIEYTGYHGEKIHVPIENILYFEADESYTKIVTYGQNGGACQLISRKLGQIEKEMKEYGFLRVHKSYLANAANMVEAGEKIRFRDTGLTIPVGRKYREQAKKCCLLFGKEQMRKRL